MRIKTLERRTPLHRQIYEQLRNSITSKELPPGARIPSSKELSARFGAAAWTVQSAMSALEKEGLVERRQRLGTFVRSETPRLSSVGIYYDVDFWGEGGMDYYRLLYGKLQTVLAAERIGCRLFEGSHDSEHFPKAVVAAAKSGEIQALLVPLVAHLSKAAFEELGIPVIGAKGAESSFKFDSQLMSSLACGWLAKQECRSVGLITSIASEFTWVIEEFKMTAAKAGLLTGDHWIERPATWVEGWELEEFGYNSFRALHARGPLPDGLFVFPDIAARGAVTGILAKRVDVPEDLKVVLHGNEGLPLFVPFPVATVLSSPAQAAAAMLDLARKEVAGESHPIPLLPYKLVEPGDEAATHANSNERVMP